ncbi:MAG: hypothetical protein Q9191_002098 [Dirinaria sp. TL-2023a]
MSPRSSVSEEAHNGNPKSALVSQGDIEDEATRLEEEKRIRLKVDLRLCTIAGLLCSLNLLDSGIISSASVTSMLADLGLDQGNRYSVSILIFTVASVCFQLPATIAVRILGPRIFFAFVTICFGLITICTAFIHTWKQMILMRVLLGIAMMACVIGIATYFWIVDFPENAHRSFYFMSEAESAYVVRRIQNDRGDGEPTPFRWKDVLRHFLDPKIYGFAATFFLLVRAWHCDLSRIFVRTNIGLESRFYGFVLFLANYSGMGFSENQAILLSAPPYYYAVIPVLLSSRIGDKYRIRGPVISFNSLCLIAGFAMLGFADQVTVRYVGCYLATGAYVSNWAALNSYQANNITGQWKRAVTAAAVTACNGLGGVAGAFIVRQPEAPRYLTAIWVSIG